MKAQIKTVLDFGVLKFFNLASILCVAVVVGIVAAWGHYFPNLFPDHYRNLIISVVLFVVGLMAEWFEVRGRILFMPVWVIGMGMMAIQSFAVWGIAGIIAPVALIGLGFCWMVRVRKKSEASQWPAASVALSELKAISSTADNGVFWRLAQQSLFLPIASDYTSEICAHDLEVMKIIAKHSTVALGSPSDRANCAAFEKFLTDNQDKEKPGQPDFDLQQKIEELIRTKRQEHERHAELANAMRSALDKHKGSSSGNR